MSHGWQRTSNSSGIANVPEQRWPSPWRGFFGRLPSLYIKLKKTSGAGDNTDRQTELCAIPDQPRGASVAERTEGPDLAGAAGQAGGTHSRAAGRLPLRAAQGGAHRNAEHTRLSVRSYRRCSVRFKTPERSLNLLFETSVACPRPKGARWYYGGSECG